MNNYKPHVFVLPEDDANRQLANGFLLDPFLSPRRVQVLEPAGGWLRVLDRFLADNVVGMDLYEKRLVILLIDFDHDAERRDKVDDQIPARLTDRVFVLGVWTEPEALRRAIGERYESIGRKMARDCREGTSDIWDHQLLRHNAAEIARLRESIKPFLFQAQR